MQYRYAAEIVRLLKAVPTLGLNWDPANDVMHGELDAFPAGWALLPKDRIVHCHCKNVARDAAGKLRVVAGGHRLHRLGRPVPRAQIRRLSRSRLAGDALARSRHPEASSRTSWAGMKKALDASGTL